LAHRFMVRHASTAAGEGRASPIRSIDIRRVERAREAGRAALLVRSTASTTRTAISFPPLPVSYTEPLCL
jgi:hypothetical protein